MPIEEIFKKATANDVISELKSCRFIPQPDVERAERHLTPSCMILTTRLFARISG